MDAHMLKSHRVTVFNNILILIKVPLKIPINLIYLPLIKKNIISLQIPLYLCPSKLQNLFPNLKILLELACSHMARGTTCEKYKRKNKSI
jgi:hypothetical protein